MYLLNFAMTLPDHSNTGFEGIYIIYFFTQYDRLKLGLDSHVKNI